MLAKRLRRPPRELATRLAELLTAAPGPVARAEVAGPGFVNLWLAGSRWQALITDLLARPEQYGRSDRLGGRKVQVEFLSANPTGPISIGHGRQAVLGDCIARLLEAVGGKVTREYYFNNGGRQMRMLGASVRARYLELLGRAAPPPEDALSDDSLPWPAEVGGLPVEFPRDGYRGEYIREIAARLREQYGDGLLEEPPDGRFRSEAERLVFEEIRATAAALGIHFDVFYNEMSLYEEGKLDETLADLFHGHALGLCLRRVDYGHGPLRLRRLRGRDDHRLVIDRVQPGLGAAPELLGSERRNVHEQEPALDGRGLGTLDNRLFGRRLIGLQFHFGHSHSV